MSLDEVELEVLAKIDLRMADFAPKTAQFVTQIDWNVSCWMVSKVLSTSIQSTTES